MVVYENKRTADLEKQRPVKEILPSGMVKHRLENPWHMWYVKRESDIAWDSCLRSVSRFDTVEDFWATYDHLLKPSQLPFLCDYHIFKEGIKPMWEDPMNQQGGKWSYTVPRASSGPSIDDLWLDMVLAVIGETFQDNSDHICGVVIQTRMQEFRVALWMSDRNNTEACLETGRHLKRVLGVPSSKAIVFEGHDELQIKKNGKFRPMHVL